MNNNSNQQSHFYHIYPLGFCGAPGRNDFFSPPVNRFREITAWIPQMQKLGINALYLGPVFESSSHGYDTADYYWPDRRLGSKEDFTTLCQALKQAGIQTVVDGVFHHVGRDFWAFRDVKENKQNSAYIDWFQNVDFSGNSPHNDGFSYGNWEGHWELAKLNLQNPDVINHLLGAVESWIRDFDIEGIRLDVAYLLNRAFLQKLSRFTKAIKPDFFLLGEVIHGDYNEFFHCGLDAVTNYEAYKGLYSAHNDRNLFEAAHSLERQFGHRGLYQNKRLYNFVDNHDVNRIASMLSDPADLHTTHILLYTMPGIPAIYYGSEWALTGRRDAHSDHQLRPSAQEIKREPKNHELENTIIRLADLKKQWSALQWGGYENLVVKSTQFAFKRFTADQEIIIAINIESDAKTLAIATKSQTNGTYRDILNPGHEFRSIQGTLRLPVDGHWGRIMVKI
ncbi:MAG: hypothetical protein JXR70_15055 [Spirochaetales bacterium]|nr:hypothetical protein [Spirochaetales bacterium]